MGERETTVSPKNWQISGRQNYFAHLDEDKQSEAGLKV